SAPTHTGPDPRTTGAAAPQTPLGPSGRLEVLAVLIAHVPYMRSGVVAVPAMPLSPANLIPAASVPGVCVVPPRGPVIAMLIVLAATPRAAAILALNTGAVPAPLLVGPA